MGCRNLLSAEVAEWVKLLHWWKGESATVMVPPLPRKQRELLDRTQGWSSCSVLPTPTSSLLQMRDLKWPLPFYMSLKSVPKKSNL